MFNVEKKATRDLLSKLQKKKNAIDKKIETILNQEIKRDFLDLLSKHNSSIIYFQHNSTMGLVSQSLNENKIFSKEKFNQLFLNKETLSLPSKTPKGFRRYQTASNAASQTPNTNSDSELNINDFCQLHLQIDLDDNIYKKNKYPNIYRFKQNIVQSSIKESVLFFDGMAIKMVLTDEMFPYTRFLNCIIYSFDYNQIHNFLSKNKAKITINSLINSIEKHEILLNEQRNMVNSIPGIFLNIEGTDDK